MKLDVPEGWSVAREWGPGPFVTHALLRRDDGAEVEWTSRRQRKRLGLRSSTDRPGPGRRFRPSQADPMSWWMGALFMVGSACFALGALPVYFDAVSPTVTAWTFFVGSLFFTSAAYLQYHEAAVAPTGVLPDSPHPVGIKAFVNWDAHRIDWWAATIQLVGTLFFNASTFAATLGDLSTRQDRRLIWAPDTLGSICFLVASWLAFSEVMSGAWWKPQRDLGWAISVLNLVGSVAFGVSAVAARYLRSAGEVANLALVNIGTFAGATCFLVGAALLPVESSTEASAATGTRRVRPQVS